MPLRSTTLTRNEPDTLVLFTFPLDSVRVGA